MKTKSTTIRRDQERQPAEETLRVAVAGYFGIDPLGSSSRSHSYLLARRSLVVLGRQLLGLTWTRLYKLMGIHPSPEFRRLEATPPESLRRHLVAIVSRINGDVPYLEMRKAQWLKEWSGQTTLFPDDGGSR